jgi:hypothetical protein
MKINRRTDKAILQRNYTKACFLHADHLYRQANRVLRAMSETRKAQNFNGATQKSEDN